MSLDELTALLGLSVTGKRILIVEDHLPSLLRLEQFWTMRGHRVVALAGVDTLEGTCATGRNGSLEISEVLDLLAIDAVFMDHYFLSSTFNGALLTRRIMQVAHPRILGMSSDNAANAAMVREGAVGAIRKSDLLRML